MLQRALQYAATFGYTVWLRPQDPWLGNGVAASGAVATRLGLSGVPVAAETIALHTIFELVRATGARVHLCRLSSAAGVALLRARQGRGPAGDGRRQHQLAAPDRRRHRLLQPGDAPDAAAAPAARPRRAARRRWPTARSTRWCRDHTPVGADEKNLPFGEAEPGATGLELLLSLALKWGDDSAACRWRRRWPRVTSEPVRVLGAALGSLAASAGRLVEGGVADVCMFDPAARWPVRAGALLSQGKHTPFAFAASGMELPGRVRATLVAGSVAFDARA